MLLPVELNVVKPVNEEVEIVGLRDTKKLILLSRIPTKCA